MKKVFRILLIIALVALTAVSCKKTDENVTEASGIIHFEVRQTPSATRSMVVDDAALRTACSPSGGAQSIGLWAAMSKAGETTNDVFQGVNLQWRPVGEKGHENNPDLDEEGTDKESYWNTFITHQSEVKHAEVYWHPGETYYFRAYYPAGVELANNTSAYTFIAEYNCEIQQDDLMAAYQKVVLADKASLQQHVQLNLLHMLSAVEFRFKFKEESGFEKSDKLMSMWLENTDAGEFGNYGLLVFGDGKKEGDAGYDPLVSPTEIDWYIMNTPAPGERMYYWENSAGIDFYRNSSENVAATAFSDPGNTTAGALFTGSTYGGHNYVYMIPQDLHPGTQICFTTENSAGNVFRVNMPDSFKDLHDVVYTSLEAGYRYTFNVVISRLDIEVFITIKEWNLIDSSYSIDF